MIQLPICPVCNEPVADQPATHWTNAYRGGIPWWHLADNSPICAAADGQHSQPALVADPLPVDNQTNTWLDEMNLLFAVDGPYDPARLGSAITAAEHLTRWLHTATGAFSALLTLPAPSDVASLIGHLHRSTRLLARVHAQTGSYLLDQARQARLASLDDSAGRSEAIDDIRAWLQDASDWLAQSAQASGAAWCSARTVAAASHLAASSTADGTDHQEGQQ
ncbi:hypothetical protein Q3V37_17630 [Micromonospora profundi]|uniref:Uncharacterized protein n=1 Tax=Micromonospora profundi TaxID=1420889 RepID=A0AAJ6HNG4_9ACTN|nr:hypothetical protein [Micromonospora profundi]WLS43242.1 hypothetical protein Q3V37_17630 [Micromonospora profundi]